MKLVSFLREGNSLEFEDEEGVTHKLSFDSVDALVKKLFEVGYIECVAKVELEIPRTWNPKSKTK